MLVSSLCLKTNSSALHVGVNGEAARITAVHLQATGPQTATLLAMIQWVVILDLNFYSFPFLTLK